MQQPPRRLTELSLHRSSDVAHRAFGGASARMTSRLMAIAALDCAFSSAHVGVSRPRCRWQLCGWRHPTTPSRRATRAIFLAIPLPPLARRPILAPVTTRFALIRTPRRPGSDRRQPRQLPAESGPNSPGALSTTPPRRPCSSPAIWTRPALSLPVPRLSAVLARQGLAWGQSAHALTAPLTRCARPTVGTVRRESSATHGRATWTRSRRSSREPSNGASTSASASAPSRTKSPPRPAASSSSAWTTSTKCSDGLKAASEPPAAGFVTHVLGHRALPAITPAKVAAMRSYVARRYPRPYCNSARINPPTNRIPIVASAIGCPDPAVNAATAAPTAIPSDTRRSRFVRRPGPRGRRRGYRGLSLVTSTLRVNARSPCCALVAAVVSHTLAALMHRTSRQRFNHQFRILAKL